MNKISLQNWWTNVKNFLFSHRELLFLAFSIIIALLVGIFMHCNQLILWLSFATSLTVYWRLPYANIEIDNKILRISWALVNFALFIAICKLCAFESAYGEHYCYVFGLLIVFFANTLFYVYVIPWISFKLKFVEDDYGWGFDENLNLIKTKTNGSTFSIMLFIATLLIGFFVDIKKDNDAQFEKEQYVKVYSWDKEVHRRNTVYIVKTSKGTFAISPSKYPEVRDINLNTKIKILTTNGSGLYNYSRLEIKN